MAFGLEVRVPLLDHDLMQFAGALPVGWKYRDGVGKYLLKKVARRYLPDSLLYRPKRGFSVPVKAWMKNGLGSRLSEMGANRGHPLWEFLRSQVVLQWLERHRAGRADHGKRLWVILMLGLWLEQSQAGRPR
jgi:asparagine synthase (glutamine-hydrolysing)